MGIYERFQRAGELFAAKDYRTAASMCENILADVAYEDSTTHGVDDVRLLLARSYFHSAQLQRAEETSRVLLQDNPTDAYAALLRARSLQRLGRRDEAERAMALATALGAPGTGEQSSDD
ncbi:tetratricopeptide repeat protein [Calidifontibacter sp. DB0510]|uniref:Tetratricopeptide repeat protein n=1 Tax=Metallococcus carri TaxID=1656884 RepID=A0A967EHW2_9MICO|nr:tetratricopeptide repeat protein [Metallococcus carri]NHN57243.1 tetratricopeptide repeat protein [Metallococcus carri]NOP37954.1 tetratricopeptide repeat protein [Calidifontibacter sp. DB2511S]